MLSFVFGLFDNPAVATPGWATVDWLLTGEEDTGLIVLGDEELELLLLLLTGVEEELAELPVDGAVVEVLAGDTTGVEEVEVELDEAVEEAPAWDELVEAPVDVFVVDAGTIVGVVVAEEVPVVDPAVFTALVWDAVTTLEPEVLAAGCVAVVSEEGFTGAATEEVSPTLEVVDPDTVEADVADVDDVDVDDVDVDEPDVDVDEPVAGVATWEMPMTEELSDGVDDVEEEPVDELVEELDDEVDDEEVEDDEVVT